ncbi:MAG: beta-propeller domain-containing protein [Clostridium sp.]|nr:beta-propeller domain-containing protein [Clostridium sp.]
MKKKIAVIIAILLVVAFVIGITLSNLRFEGDLTEISSEKQLQKIVDRDNLAEDIASVFICPLIAVPTRSFSEKIIEDASSNEPYNGGLELDDITVDESNEKNSDSVFSGTTTDSSKSTYSTTNIQVENVDEADIVKTDGYYIYSIADDTVYITYAKNPNEMNIVAKIEEPLSSLYPEDLILQNNKLIIISGNTAKTVVKIYDLSDIENPNKIKEFEINKEYYTSRYINGNLYVISSGRIRDEGNLEYVEDGATITPEKPNAYKINDLNTSMQTIIASYNLNSPENKIKVQSYLMDVENAYISEKNMYLIDNGYSGSRKVEFTDIFGIKGLLGIGDAIQGDNRTYGTNIYKFNFKEDGSVVYQTKNQLVGTTIDQFSLDEKDDNLRIALYTTNGSRVVVLDNDLEQLGETEYLAKGEKMYSARFVGDRAYLVTYKNMDPLYSIDLSDPENPKALGTLKIPGYSTYLQPYDENHIIGFGFQTEETVKRNSLGRVTSTSAKVMGMKMALFDVSDINNPKMISEEVIGDARTNSTVLENHKSLLLDKERNLLAIPIKNYTTDLSVTENDDIFSATNLYTSYLKSRTYNKVGYAVYSLDIANGFNLRGIITHDVNSEDYTSDIRGLYIDDILYTVSNKEIKANNINTLEEIKEILF